MKKVAHGRADRTFWGAHFEHPKTAERLATQHGVSRATIERDGQYASAGRRYNRMKKAHGGDRKSSAQIEHLKTAQTLATQHGVSRATIERDGQYATAVEKLRRTVG
jgi:hypothetical protein